MRNHRIALASVLLGYGFACQSVMSEPPDGSKADDKKDAFEKFIKSFGEPIQIKESKPVTVNGVQFVAVAQTGWQPPKPSEEVPLVVPIEIQLRITNVGKGNVLLPTDKTFGIRVLDADDKQVKARAGREAATVTGPILLPGAASCALWRRALLRFDAKSKVSELLYHDGSGSEAIIGPLRPGPYKLVFWYSVPRDKAEKEEKGGATAWAGEVVTEELSIQILEGTTRGRVPDVDPGPGASKQLVRISQSNAVTKNNASFTIVAQSQWKAGLRDGPIDLQLHITNLSKQAVSFPTFDTFGLRVIGADGKQIRARGGRSGTVFTRPVVIGPGASYSICRKADVTWTEGQASEMVYQDGTGDKALFGPLRPGRYRLSFFYSVAPDPPLKDLLRREPKEGDPPTWLGSVFTDEVLVHLQGAK